MVNRIDGGSGMAREAIAAALRTQQQAAQNIAGSGAAPAGLGVTQAQSAGGIAPTQFIDQIAESLSQVSNQVSAADKLPEQMLRGEVNDFHDIAIQLKQSDLSFRFALQVRNKLIDAYREVMRMSV
jgi:flagellar hook-basal body complex protein FliE